MDKQLFEDWAKVNQMVVDRFGEKMDEQTILFIIGLQELGVINDSSFEKNEKVDIIHIGICTVLSKDGYYQFIGKDDDGWPHFKNIKKLPFEIQGEYQNVLIKQAIIDYFDL